MTTDTIGETAMFIGRSTIAVRLLHAVGIFVALWANSGNHAIALCQVTVTTTTPTPMRTGNNQVSASSSMYPTQIYGNWTVHITVTLQFATQVNGPYSNVASWMGTRNWSEGPTPLGVPSSVTVSVNQTLEPRGTGFYRTVTFVEGLATSSNCNGQLVAASGSPRYSAVLQVQRPARPDYMTGFTSTLWFLGPGVQANGAYSAITQFRPGATNGAVGTPQFVVVAGSDKLALSCTTCTNPQATALAASGGCSVYDVVVQTSYGGFLSEPFFLFINRPWNTAATWDVFDSNAWWIKSDPFGSGYETRVNYTVHGLCVTDPAMNFFDLNEWVGPLIRDPYPSSNWPYPQTGGKFVDDVTATDYVRATGDPNTECDGNPCVPAFSNPGVGPHIWVDYLPQWIFIGHPSSGAGVRVQTASIQRYSDSAWLADIVNPAPQ